MGLRKRYPLCPRVLQDGRERRPDDLHAPRRQFGQAQEVGLPALEPVGHERLDRHEVERRDDVVVDGPFVQRVRGVRDGRLGAGQPVGGVGLDRDRPPVDVGPLAEFRADGIAELLRLPLVANDFQRMLLRRRIAPVDQEWQLPADSCFHDAAPSVVLPRVPSKRDPSRAVMPSRRAIQPGPRSPAGLPGVLTGAYALPRAGTACGIPGDPLLTGARGQLPAS